jgi:hypothetical protein
MKGIDFRRVRQRVGLVEFVHSLGVELRQEGDCYRAQCPLHREKHGDSLILYPDERWHCHGKCARGRDVIDLAREIWQLDLAQTVERLLSGELLTNAFAATARSELKNPLPSHRKWPARNLEELNAIVRGGLGLYDSWESSPCRFDDGENHAEEIIETIFPGDPLLCCGQTNEVFATRRRSLWRGRLADFALIVANPMLHPSGRTRAGKMSQHTLEATAARVYLPIECDFNRYDNDGEPAVFCSLVEAWEQDGISTLDACAAILWYLSLYLPLVLIVHSGGKSLHGWFAAFDRDQDTELWPFMQKAYALGADHVTWSRSQFVRLPDGRRQNGAPQPTFYFDPAKAVQL